jgi:hypothetical protein
VADGGCCLSNVQRRRLQEEEVTPLLLYLPQWMWFSLDLFFLL